MWMALLDAAFNVHLKNWLVYESGHLMPGDRVVLFLVSALWTP
jgi:hypothetical protein